MRLESLKLALQSIPLPDDAPPSSDRVEDVVGAAIEFSKLLRKVGIQQTREVRELLNSVHQDGQAEQIREAWQREQHRAVTSEQQLRKLAEVIVANFDIFDRMLAELQAAGLTEWETQTRQAIDVCLHNAEKAGLVPLGIPGETFDPAVHDLTREIRRQSGPLQVRTVITRGYALNGKVLRRAAVDHADK